MNTLAIYDIDDTIFFANQPIIVVNSEGEEIDQIDHEEYKRREDSGERHHSYSWRMLENADNFVQTLRPNYIVIKQLINDLQNPHIDVVLVTARTSVDNIHRFREAFSIHGIELGSAEIIFAGDNCPGDRSWLNKRIEFEKIFNLAYHHVIVYDDSARNLEMFNQVSLDYPHVTTTQYWIDYKGQIKTYYQ